MTQSIDYYELECKRVEKLIANTTDKKAKRNWRKYLHRLWKKIQGLTGERQRRKDI